MALNIALFARFSPHGAGQYETVKDLTLALRRVGVNAQFIDCGTDSKGTVREGLVDGELETVPLSWALENADIAIRHTSVPDEVYSRIPVILALHGRPENSFRLEYYERHPVLTTIIGTRRNYAGFITFWEELVFPWSWILDRSKVQYVPAPINFDAFPLEGDKHDFGESKGDVNLVCCDMWREDRCPFNLIWAAQYYKEHYNPDCKLHLYGVPTTNKAVRFMAPVQAHGVIGEVGGLVAWLPKVMRAADAILTPNIIATRIIRESLTLGTPVVAPHGCPYTEYKADPRDYKEFAREIDRCIRDKPKAEDLRQQAKREFDPIKSANALKAICEDVLEGQRLPWGGMSISKYDWQALENFIKINNIESVVEFGSGATTKKFKGMGLKVTAYETKPDFARKLKVELPDACIRNWSGKEIPAIGADLAFIDGPHGGKNREPAYKSVAMSKPDYVACHDMHRPEDMQWVEKHLSDWRGVLGTNHLLILRRPDVSGGKESRGAGTAS